MFLPLAGRQAVVTTPGASIFLLKPVHNRLARDFEFLREAALGCYHRAKATILSRYSGGYARAALAILKSFAARQKVSTDSGQLTRNDRTIRREPRRQCALVVGEVLKVTRQNVRSRFIEP